MSGDTDKMATLTAGEVLAATPRADEPSSTANGPCGAFPVGNDGVASPAASAVPPATEQAAT